MKKTVLKVLNLNGIDEYFGKLKHISFHSYEGELCSFIGLNQSEKKALFERLCGDVDFNWRETAIYVNEKRIYDKEDLQKRVYALSRNNYGLQNWTAAQYLCLNQMKGILTFRKRNQMNKMASEILETFDIDLEVNQKLEDLDPLQQRMIEVVKGICYGADILIIGEDDFFGGMTDKMVQIFCSFLKRAIHQNMTAIMLGGTDTSIIEYSNFAEQTIIMHQGMIVKKVMKEDDDAIPTLQKMILGYKNLATPSALIQEKTVNQIQDMDICFEAYTNQRHLYFPPGTVSLILCRDNIRKQQLYANLSGRDYLSTGLTKEEDFTCKLDGKVLDYNYFSFLEQRIVSLDKVGTYQDVFDNFTLEENLLLPSMRKFTLIQYPQVYYKLGDALLKERRLQNLVKKRNVAEMNVNDRICLVFEQWLIFRPKVLILFEPFLNTDAAGVSNILKYIAEFQRQGAAIIVIKTNLEYIEAITNQIFVF